MDEQQGGGRGLFFTVYRVLFALLSFGTGLFFTIWGGKLLSLGGSAWYLLAGLAYLLIAVGYLVRSRYVLPFAILTFLLTLCWALYEVQLSYWGLIPRLVVPALMLMLALWLAATLPIRPARRRYANWSASAIFLLLLATLVSAFYPHGGIHQGVVKASDASTPTLASKSDNWAFFGRDASGTRFAPYDEITPQNVKNLKVAWTYHTGRRLTGAGIGVDENTPLQIGDTLYSCTPLNVVTALDADTGKARWRFDPHASTAEHVTCRGVGYYDVQSDDSLSAEEKASPALQQCPSVSWCPRSTPV
ncbi:hypothetical protein N5J30_29450 [Klebsiella michiganensis]|nr:hypothetical protein [Klebsiella michiganensis]MDH1974741.1 hypothetical protein [Klebsiella michiganensis]